MSKKEKSTEKIRYIEDKKVKGFGLEIPNKPIKKPKDPKPKDDKK